MVAVPEHRISRQLDAEARHPFLASMGRTFRAGRDPRRALRGPALDSQLAQNVVVGFHMMPFAGWLPLTILPM